MAACWSGRQKNKAMKEQLQAAGVCRPCFPAMPEAVGRNFMLMEGRKACGFHLWHSRLTLVIL